MHVILVNLPNYSDLWFDQAKPGANLNQTFQIKSSTGIMIRMIDGKIFFFSNVYL